MDPSNLTWSKPSKPMHSMPFSMSLTWTELLDHLEHVTGPYWCLWAGPHHFTSTGHRIRFGPNRVRRNVNFHGMGNYEDVDVDLDSIKLKIPNFQGKNDCEAYLKWEKKVD